MASKLTLVYFNIKGRAELIRLILHAAGVKFVDDRIEFSDWPARKDEVPNGTLPYIVYQGRQVGEALPIARFLARKYKLMGKDELEQLDADVILNHVEVLRNAGVRCKMDSMLNEAQKKDLEKKFVEENVPRFLQLIEDKLNGSITGFLVGANLTIADLAVFDIVDVLLLPALPDVLKNYPMVAEHLETVRNMPRISAYLAERPQTDR